jgi:pimeloyl-ACP methyl ester carboxylesterase
MTDDAPPVPSPDAPPDAPEQPSSVRPSLSRRLELVWGRCQLEALEFAVGAFARLRPSRLSRLSVPGLELAMASRPGRAGATPLVCLHGFGGDKETWLLLAAALGPSVPLYAIDLPGHGGSTMPGEPVTIGCHARAALAAMDRLGIERAVVCGNSMGGGVALRLAVDHPERVAALVLISSVGSDVHHHAAVAAWRTGKNPLIPEEHEIDDFIASALDGPSHIPISVIRYVATTRARAATRLRQLFEDFAGNHGAEGVPADLSAITAPALILHGEKDPLVDHAAAEELHVRLPGSELHHLPRVGHAPQLEAPRRTAQLVRDFLHRSLRRVLRSAA